MALKIEGASYGDRAAMPAATSSTAGLIPMPSMGGFANLGYVVSLISHGTIILLREHRLDPSAFYPWL
jgi:hypothetical protein